MAWSSVRPMVSLSTKKENRKPPSVVPQRNIKVPEIPIDFDISIKGVIMVMTSIQYHWEMVAKEMRAS